MSNDDKIWIGADPGGKGNFGLAIVADSSTHICSVDCAEEAVEEVDKRVQHIPSGVGVDAPLWWPFGRSSLREADKWIRESLKKTGCSVSTVAPVNYLQGAAIAQGLMFVQLLRKRYPSVPVTEAHPKAVLCVLGKSAWLNYFDLLPPENKPVAINLSDEPDNERDALIAAVAAREGFEGRWLRDLTRTPAPSPSEQHPSHHWISPIHYFWPDPEIE